jgi:DNA-binding winged helix-turn-helix (wHTH) protein/TolB-like protein/Tfp pilus assembly protein PilF
MSLELESNVHQNNLKTDKSPERKVYEFEGFRLDAAHLMLYRDGEELSLTPKQVETLLALVENRGEIVSKDVLMQRLWGDSIVEESNLIQNIYVLRKILGDTSQGRPMIETLRRRGYRFNGEVTTNGPSSSQIALVSEISASDPAPDAGQQANPESAAVIKAPERRRKIAVVAALFVAVSAGIGLGYYFLFSTTIRSGDKKSIAVLPLRPINTANRDEIYEIGIADSLIHQISSMKGLIVRPLSSTRQYTDIAGDPIAVGREQKVDYVLSSNYQLADGKIRITTQLFNVASGQAEETYKIEKDAGNVFAMQDAIAVEVGSKLLAHFDTTSGDLIAKRGTTNEEAYRFYLQGMYLYDRRNSPDARKAVEALEQAVRLDPNYAQAWAGKAHAHRYASNLGPNIDTREEYRKSIEAINKALALDANLSEAYSALCENKYFYEYDFQGAERECKRAIELNPNSSMAHEIYSRFLSSRGRHDEAIAEIKRAIDLEPTSLFNQRNLGVALFYARRYEEAVTQLKRVIEMDKNFHTTYTWLSITLALQGKESESFEWFLKQQALREVGEETLEAYKTAFKTSGWHGVLREEANRNTGRGLTYAAGFNALVGNKDKAFEYLERSYQRREWGMAYLQVDPRFDPVRGDPRFDELVKRVEVK